MLTVRSLRVEIGSSVIVAGIDLDVADGQVLGLLGPSGSGKTTILRAVAGLQTITKGTVSWEGEDLAGVPAHRRRFGLMFQDYALFPHRTVAGNVAFGLRMQGVPTDQVRRRVADVLAWVDLSGYEDRPVAGLSGGEQQRVALARALAPEPRLLMFDEPVGSLDRTLRERLIGDMRRVLAERNVTALYVTHDQDEAMTVSDRLAVLREGRIVQTGPPADVWATPVDEWTARFLGHDNIVDRIPGVTDRRSLIRVDAIAVGDGPLPATVASSTFRSGTTILDLDLSDGTRLTAQIPGHGPEPGAAIRVRIDPGGVVALG